MKTFNRLKRLGVPTFQISLACTLALAWAVPLAYGVEIECNEKNADSAPKDIASTINQILIDSHRSLYMSNLRKGYCGKYLPGPWKKNDSRLFNQLIKEETEWQRGREPRRRETAQTIPPAEALTLKRHALKLLLVHPKMESAEQKALLEQLHNATQSEATKKNQQTAQKNLKVAISNLENPKSPGSIEKKKQKIAELESELSQLKTQIRHSSIVLARARVNENQHQIAKFEPALKALETKIQSVNQEMNIEKERLNDSKMFLERLQAIQQEFTDFSELEAQDAKRVERHQQLKTLLAKLPPDTPNSEGNCLEIFDLSSFATLHAIENQVEKIDGLLKKNAKQPPESEFFEDENLKKAFKDRITERSDRAKDLAIKIQEKTAAVNKLREKEDAAIRESLQQAQVHAKEQEREHAAAREDVAKLNAESDQLFEVTQAALKDAKHRLEDLTQFASATAENESIKKLTWTEKRLREAEKKTVGADVDVAKKYVASATQAEEEGKRLHNLAGTATTPGQATIYKNAIVAQKERAVAAHDAIRDLFRAAEHKKEGSIPKVSVLQVPSLPNPKIDRGSNTGQGPRKNFIEEAPETIQTIFERAKNAAISASKHYEKAKAELAEAQKSDGSLTHRVLAAQNETKEAERSKNEAEGSFNKIEKLKKKFDKGAQLASTLTEHSDASEKDKVQRQHLANSTAGGLYQQLEEELAKAERNLHATAQHAALSEAWLYPATLEKRKAREAKLALELAQAAEHKHPEPVTGGKIQPHHAESDPQLRKSQPFDEEDSLSKAHSTHSDPTFTHTDTHTESSASQSSSQHSPDSLHTSPPTSVHSLDNSPEVTHESGATQAARDLRWIHKEIGDPVTEIEVRKMDRAAHLHHDPNDPNNDARFGREGQNPNPNYIHHTWPHYYQRGDDGTLQLSPEYQLIDGKPELRPEYERIKGKIQLRPEYEYQYEKEEEKE